MALTKILVAVQLGPNSKNVLEIAARIAEDIHAKLSCLHIIGNNVQNEKFSAAPEQIRRKSETKLAKIAHDVLSSRSLSYDIIVSKGDFEKRVVKVAEFLRVNFILWESGKEIFLSFLNIDYLIEEDMLKIERIASDYGVKMLSNNIVREMRL